MVGKRGKRLVIVNLQSTPMDHLSDLRIFAKTDQVSVCVCVCVCVCVVRERERERVRGATGVPGQQSADGETGSGDPSVPAAQESLHQNQEPHLQ